jgi:hypothetical protein
MQGIRKLRGSEAPRIRSSIELSDSGSSEDQKPASGGGGRRSHTQKYEKKASGSKSFKHQQPASGSRACRSDMLSAKPRSRSVRGDKKMAIGGENRSKVSRHRSASPVSPRWRRRWWLPSPSRARRRGKIRLPATGGNTVEVLEAPRSHVLWWRMEQWVSRCTGYMSEQVLISRQGLNNASYRNRGKQKSIFDGRTSTTSCYRRCPLAKAGHWRRG